ncbi:hypothetical protein BDB01DRAFT_774217, partial [Pilobolus umbonatus]
MTTCLGNHDIHAIYIDTDKLKFKYIHEKDKSLKHDSDTTDINCLYSKDLKILDMG